MILTGRRPCSRTLLREAQDLLRHQIPDDDLAAIFARALALSAASGTPPSVAPADPTPQPSFYDETYEYLASVGITPTPAPSS